MLLQQNVYLHLNSTFYFSRIKLKNIWILKHLWHHNFDRWTHDTSSFAVKSILCYGGFKFPHHKCVCWILNQDWFTGSLWCHKSRSKAHPFNLIFTKCTSKLTLSADRRENSLIVLCIFIRPHGGAQTFNWRWERTTLKLGYFRLGRSSVLLPPVYLNLCVWLSSLLTQLLVSVLIHFWDHFERFYWVL